MEEEEQNWRQFREEQQAEQQQKKGDMWGIKERTSWDAGDSFALFDKDGKWKSRREKKRNIMNVLESQRNWRILCQETETGISSQVVCRGDQNLEKKMTSSIAS